MKISAHFDIREFVDPTIFNKYGAASQWFIDQKVIEFMEIIRERFGKAIYVNDWYRGGNLQERGYRIPDTSTGAWYSQHKFGRACDFNVLGMESSEVFDDVVSNQEFYLSIGVTTIEDAAYSPTWTHLDMRWTGLNEIKIVKP